MNERQELINRLKEEGNTIRIDEPDFIATEWKESKDTSRFRYWSTCFELLEGRWEGFTSISGVAK